MNNGLMCYPLTGTIDGVHGNHILLAPAYIIQAFEIEEIIDNLTASINSVLTVLYVCKTH